MQTPVCLTTCLCILKGVLFDLWRDVVRALRLGRQVPHTLRSSSPIIDHGPAHVIRT
jgi:hypothetical protein